MTEQRSDSDAGADLLEMYRRMLTIRKFEEAVLALHGRGMVPGGIHLSIGQEAEIVGACMALRADDFMTGNHRSHGHPIGKGARVAPLMAEIMGKATGVCKGKGGSVHLADFSVGSLGESGIVGSALPVAAGAGLSAQMRGSDQVCLAFFGDGAINTGAFYESMNLSATWRLPVVYLCENNLYATTTASADVTGGSTLANRACAFEIPGLQVDGQDCVAVYEIVCEAVRRARSGEWPSLVETLTYRYREHAEFGNLQLPPYRAEGELEAWEERDPLIVHRVRLRPLYTEDYLTEIDAEITSLIDEAVEFGKASDYPEPEAAFSDLYSAPFPIYNRF